jgi:flagellar motor switch protein FliG
MPREAISEAAQIVKSYVAKAKPLQKAAILLNCLTPEVTVEVSRGLSEREIKTLMPEMERLPYSNSIESVAVINEFFHIHRLWPAVGGVMSDSQDILRALEKWSARNPRRLAKLLKESWLSPRI